MNKSELEKNVMDKLIGRKSCKLVVSNGSSIKIDNKSEDGKSKYTSDATGNTGYGSLEFLISDIYDKVKKEHYNIDKIEDVK